MTGKVFEKFTFDVHFDEPLLTLIPEEEEEIKPTFFQEDLDRARLEGYQQGAQEKQAQMWEDASLQMVSVLQRLAQQLPPFLQTYQLQKERLEKGLKEVVLVSLEKLLPSFTPDQGIAQVEELLQTCVPFLMTSPEIILRVHPSLKEALSEKLSQLSFLKPYEGKVTLATQETEDVKYCCLEWGTGRAILNREALHEKIREMIQTSSLLQELLGISGEEAPLLEKKEVLEIENSDSLPFQEEAQSPAPAEDF